MEIEKITINGLSALRIVSGKGTVIQEPGDVNDLIAVCWEMEVKHLVVDKEQLDPSFFDLRTGLAGEVLQKLTTYRIRLAILGDFTDYTSQALRDFIRESNRQGNILFVADLKAVSEYWKD